jgi:hypothetical protein
MPESYIEGRLSEAIKSRGGLAIKLWPLSFTGLPDRLILLPGARIYFVETKWSEKGPRPRQIVVHRQLTALGFRVFVVRDNESLKSFLMVIDIL